MIMKKRIWWLTVDSFVDCDWIPIQEVSKEYAVEWFVVLPEKGSRYSETDFKEFIEIHKNVNIHFYHVKYAAKDPRRVIDYYKVGKMARESCADIYYVNNSPSLPWFGVFWWQLPRDRKVITAHQGVVHIGMRHKFLTTLSRDLIYRNAQMVNMFSKSQSELFRERYKKPRIELINLALKDYGTPTVKEAGSTDSCVNFLCFGLLNYAKNIDLLIDAACNIYEQGVRGFKVLIYGSCKDWSFYQEHIKYPEIFETSIGFVSNEDIPNLLARTHFFVQPYRVVSQSGAMKVAFQYNTPVIVSDLAGFTDELEEGTNGYSFKVGDVKDLERVMKERIANFSEEYDDLCLRMATYTAEHYSSESIGRKYLQMINNIEIKNNEMTAKEKISKLIRSNPVTDNVITRCRLFGEMLWHYKQFRRNFGRLGMNKSESKYSADLRIRVHAIEKGLALPNPRPGFGEAKVKSILERVDYYIKHFKDSDFLPEVKSILDSYFEFQETHNHKNEQLLMAYSHTFANVMGGGGKNRWYQYSN